MFDDINQKEKNNKKEVGVNPKISQDLPQEQKKEVDSNQKKEKVEDIYAEVDKGPVPSGLPSKEAEIALNMSSGLKQNSKEPRGSSGKGKKILFLGGLLIILIILIGGGYFLINNLMTPADENINVTQNPDLNKDSDDDGLTDAEEKSLGTNPNVVDTDKDGLSDSEEVRVFLTDPLLKDTDGDGVSDAEEILNSTDPLVAEQTEIATSSEKMATSSQDMEIEKDLDTDNDGLTDKEERKYDTNIQSPDTDDDGLSDYQEIMIYLSDPLSKDTDGDGYTDGEEVTNGYNPLGEGKLSGF